MNKNQDSEEFIHELETTGKIEILNDEETKEYDKIMEVHGSKVTTFVSACKNAGYSEFVIGTIIGRYYTLQDKQIQKRGWRRWVPEVLK